MRCNSRSPANDGGGTKLGDNWVRPINPSAEKRMIFFGDRNTVTYLMHEAPAALYFITISTGDVLESLNEGHK
jgi:hypothetical protein